MYALRKHLKMMKLLFLIAAGLLASGMFVAASQAREVPEPPSCADQAGKTVQSSSETHPAGKLIMARYYGKRFKGRKTSSGAIYNPNKLTAAHPSLPMGTRVQVVNPANHRSVVVTINDRCRKRKKSYIDLSLQAARQLGILHQGKTKVLMTLLDGNDEENNEDRLSEDQESEENG